MDIASVGVSPFLLLRFFLGFSGVVSEVFLCFFSLGFISSQFPSLVAREKRCFCEISLTRVMMAS